MVFKKIEATQTTLLADGCRPLSAEELLLVGGGDDGGDGGDGSDGGGDSSAASGPGCAVDGTGMSCTGGVSASISNGSMSVSAGIDICTVSTAGISCVSASQGGSDANSGGPTWYSGSGDCA